MSVLKKSVLGIMTIILLILGLTKYNDHKENNALKKALDNHDYIPALHYLLKSDRYSDEIQKAGVSIVRDKTMAFENTISAIEIKGKTTLTVNFPDKDSKTIRVFCNISIENQSIDAILTLNKDLELNRASYFLAKENGVEHTTISKTEEDQLLQLVQDDIINFLDTMANLLYESHGQ